MSQKHICSYFEDNLKIYYHGKKSYYTYLCNNIQ